MGLFRHSSTPPEKHTSPPPRTTSRKAPTTNGVTNQNTVNPHNSLHRRSMMTGTSILDHPDQAMSSANEGPDAITPVAAAPVVNGTKFDIDPKFKPLPRPPPSSESASSRTPSPDPMRMGVTVLPGEDPAIAAARQRVISAENAEREADKALIAARNAVAVARAEVKKLEMDAAEEARLAHIKQAQAAKLGERAEPLGSKSRFKSKITSFFSLSKLVSKITKPETGYQLLVEVEDKDAKPTVKEIFDKLYDEVKEKGAEHAARVRKENADQYALHCAGHDAPRGRFGFGRRSAT